MKPLLPTVMALGMSLLGAAGSQAYGPSPGSAPLSATEPAFIKVHAIGFEAPREDTGQNPYTRRKAISHTNCRFGRYGGRYGHDKRAKQGWHKHIEGRTHPCSGPKPIEGAPVVGPGRCAALPASRCTCVARNPVEKCCTRWACAQAITNPQRYKPLSNPQTRAPFKGLKPKPFPGLRRVPPSPIAR